MRRRKESTAVFFGPVHWSWMERTASLFTGFKACFLPLWGQGLAPGCSGGRDRQLDVRSTSLFEVYVVSGHNCAQCWCNEQSVFSLSWGVSVWLQRVILLSGDIFVPTGPSGVHEVKSTCWSCRRGSAVIRQNLHISFIVPFTSFSFLDFSFASKTPPSGKTHH